MTSLDAYVIHRVNVEDADDVETLGTKPKFWWYDAEGKRMLFKAEDRGTGEDWAEKIACELCTLLELPHVHYEMAQEYRNGKPQRPGVICENLAKSPLSLVLGNQLLVERDPNYPGDEQRRYKVRTHTVDAIADVLHNLAPPLGWKPESHLDTALDIFVGYILLDTWTANQDRHHGNWGAVSDSHGKLHLAPTFDHGAGLARLLTDSDRHERLHSRDRGRSIESYASKARSACYANTDSAKTMLSMDCFAAFARLATSAAKAWQNKLRNIDDDTVASTVRRVPTNRLSAVAAQFTLQLLAENKKRILQLEIQ